MKKKILVVDDEPDVLRSVKECLECLNISISVEGVDSAHKCLKYLKDCNILPDLILLDIMMPEMNGWQLLNRIKEVNKWNDIPLIFLTAKTDDFTKTFGKSQAIDFIEKPFAPKDLQNRIINIIKNIENNSNFE